MGHRAVVLLAACALLAAAACSRKTEDEKIRKAISSVQKAAENRDAKEVLSFIDRDFRDAEGNDYQALRGMLLCYFFRHQKVSVIVTNLDVAVDGPSATARFQAILSGRSAQTGDVLPEALGAYRFEAGFRKDKDDWKVVTAKWERWGEGMPDAGQNR